MVKLCQIEKLNIGVTAHRPDWLATVTFEKEDSDV